jgi:hypothetical protein
VLIYIVPTVPLNLDGVTPGTRGLFGPISGGPMWLGPICDGPISGGPM